MVKYMVFHFMGGVFLITHSRKEYNRIIVEKNVLKYPESLTVV